eukprot:CAMPEP_0184557234 /NCGR_PEP_ID=MMETSP0199_2-20130426/42213_1 /TAXON_ID=1112570 /ORGANISM="Thraustochytrium sp., Strain LLF1b" /LENGTH=304 /DNA_ID=CAMNT_0026954107 /DNA_START=167 /DNA_END=1077 /DNA_ORIENTATION=+
MLESVDVTPNGDDGRSSVNVHPKPSIQTPGQGDIPLFLNNSMDTAREDLAEQITDKLRQFLEQLDEEEVNKTRGSESAALAGNTGGLGPDKATVYGNTTISLDMVLRDLDMARRHGCVAIIEQDLLVRLVGILDSRLISAAAASDRGLELNIVLGLLGIMTSRGLDPRVVSTDSLENIVSSCKTLMHKVVFPAIDSGFTAKIGASGTSKHAKTRKKSKRFRKQADNTNGAPQPGHSNDHDSEEEVDDSVSGQESLHLTSVQIEALVPALCSALLLLNNTIAQVPNLEDELLLQIASLCVSTLFV